MGWPSAEQKDAAFEFACRWYVTIARIIATSDNRVGSTSRLVCARTYVTYTEKYMNIVAAATGIIGRDAFSFWKWSKGGNEIEQQDIWVKITGYALEEAFADYRLGRHPPLTTYGERKREREKRTDWLRKFWNHAMVCRTGGIRLVTVMALYTLCITRGKARR